MGILYSIFILAVVVATFVVIFSKLAKKSYWIMILIAFLYLAVLILSFIHK